MTTDSGQAAGLDLAGAVEAVQMDDIVDSAWMEEDFYALAVRAVDVAAPLIAAQVREQVARGLLAVDPVEWALAGMDAGHLAARIARGEVGA